MPARHLRFVLAAAALLQATIFAHEHLQEKFSSSLDNWVVEQMPGGKVYAENGAMIIEDVGGCTVWFRHPLRAPAEISYEVEVMQHGGPCDRVSDLNCFWMASDPKNPADPFTAKPARMGKFSDYDGLLTYYVGYGGNENTTTRFRRYDGTGVRPLLPEHDLREPKFLLRANHRYRIRIVAKSTETEFWRDGEKIFAFRDSAPLTRGYFGFRTVKSHLVIRHFEAVTSAEPAN